LVSNLEAQALKKLDVRADHVLDGLRRIALTPAPISAR
jgi:hypothetical protein